MTDQAQVDQANALMAMMGNAQAMEQFARDKGWTDEQIAVWLANMGNVNYVLPVGLGVVPPEPQAPPPPEGGATRASPNEKRAH